MNAWAAPAEPPFPRTEADLTPAWFTRALSARFPGVEVAAAEPIRRIDGTATKLRFQLSYARTGVGPTPPQTLWAKAGFAAGGAHQGEAFANEARFYVELAPQVRANLPDCYFGAVDAASSDGLVLLEDLTPRGAVFPDPVAGLSLDQMAAVLEMQAAYHARFWGQGLAARRWLKAGGSIAETAMVDQYFEGFWSAAQALPRFAAVPPALRDRSRVQAALNRMVAADTRAPVCLVHGDSQLANLFFDGEGRPGLLDWQHVMRGSWAFDVAHMMVTGLSVADRRAHEHDLLAAYRARLVEEGAAPPPLAEMRREYARHALWAFMWVMCPVSAHPEAVCAANAARACAAIVDLDGVALNEAA